MKMKRRKKKVLDGIDREIIRVIYERETLVSSEIARLVGLSSSAIPPRLENLRERGVIKKSNVLGIRSFKRRFGKKNVKVQSPRAIYWKIDLKEDD